MPDRFPEGADELAADARHLLSQIDQGVPAATTVDTDCRPPLDVLEMASALEVIVDVPGVPAEALRVAVRRGVLLVVGRKPAAPLEPKGRFHVAERSQGRFARVVRLDAPCDASRSRAVLASGQLRVVLPLVSGHHSLQPIPVERP